MNSVYVCADIHGDIEGYMRLLELINFDDSDHMIIAGDVLDRGKYGIELFDHVINQENAELLLGNHEMFASMYLKGELDRATWERFGGEYTVKSIECMDATKRQTLLETIEILPLYKEIDSVRYGKTIVTHTGLDVDNLVYTEDGKISVPESIDKAYKINRYNFMCGRDIHYASANVLKNLSHYVIVGHVPTYYINSEEPFKACVSPYYTDIDCGRGKIADEGKICCYNISSDSFVYVD